MSSIKYGGSLYLTVNHAAAAWAADSLPDSSVVEPEEDPAQVARELEAFVWIEAQAIGEGAPEDVDEEEWRAALREQIALRIVREWVRS
jgi:hypothetical protein